VDECTLGAHDCGPMYQCKNTQGSFRCVPKRCEDNQVLDPGTGECKVFFGKIKENIPIFY